MLIVSVAAAEAPPPGVPLTTVIACVPAVAASAVCNVTVSRVALTKLVVRAFPSRSTVDPFTNPVPLTVNAGLDVPAVKPTGDSDEIAGVGLFTVNVWPAVTPPPGAGTETVTLKVPAVAICPTGTVAVSCVPETRVVERSRSAKARDC